MILTNHQSSARAPPPTITSRGDTPMSSDVPDFESADAASGTTLTRRRFSTALAASAAYAALNPVSIAGQSPVSAPQPELCGMTAVELASRLARKNVSAREV